MVSFCSAAASSILPRALKLEKSSQEPLYPPYPSGAFPAPSVLHSEGRSAAEAALISAVHCWAAASGHNNATAAPSESVELISTRLC
jgi:hypothetical protein